MADQGPVILGVASTFLILPWLTVLARCYVRVKLIKAFALDDWLAVVTLFFLTIYAILFYAGVATGIGRHVWELTAAQRVSSMKIWYYGELIYIITATVFRATVGTSLLRIAIRTVHRGIIHALIGLNIIFGIAYFLFTIFQCSPINSFWTRLSGELIEPYVCQTRIAVNLTFMASAIAIVIDWTFGILPLFMLWELDVTLRKRIGLAVIMGLGVVASTGPLVRIPETNQLASTDDFLHDTVGVGIWSFVEPGVGLTVTSFLTLRPLFVKIFNVRSSSDKSGSRRISERPSRPGDGDDNIWQHENQTGGLVILQAIRSEERKAAGTPDSFQMSDAGTAQYYPSKYNTAVRIKCEPKSNTEVDYIDTKTFRLTPPNIGAQKSVDYV